jgi:hypothetical protein
MCTAWPFPGRPKVTLDVKSPMVFVTADYDLKCVSPSRAFITFAARC